MRGTGKLKQVIGGVKKRLQMAIWTYSIRIQCNVCEWKAQVLDSGA